MGLLDIVSSATEQYGGGNEHAQAAGGLLQEIEQRPGGISSIFQAFQQNGMGGLIQQWAGGQTQPVPPQQVNQGLGGTGIIESVSQRTGMSPAAVTNALAVLAPIIIHHFVSNGHVTPDGQATGAPPPETGGLLQSVLSRIL